MIKREIPVIGISTEIDIPGRISVKRKYVDAVLQAGGNLLHHFNNHGSVGLWKRLKDLGDQLGLVAGPGAAGNQQLIDPTLVDFGQLCQALHCGHGESSLHT